MNAIKNTVVTVTLLVVGFGAYTVLKSPTLDENELTWDATADLLDPDIPETSLPEPGVLSDTDTVVTSDQPSTNFMDRLSPPRTEGQLSEDYGTERHAHDNHADAGNPTDDHAAPEWDHSSAEEEFDRTADRVGETTLPLLPDENNSADQSESQGDSDYATAQTVDPNQTPDESFYGTASTEANSADQITSPRGTDEPPTASNGTDSEFENAMNYVRVQLQQDQLGEALLALSQLDRSGLTPQETQEVQKLLDQLAGTVIYSPSSYLLPGHVVQDGETLDDIARKYKIPSAFILRVNGLEDGYQPLAGETLKVVPGPFRAVIDGTTGELTLYLGEHYAGRFAVQLGNDAPRTDGRFEVIEKSDGREFFDRKTGYRIAKSDPNNPYGNRWIGLRGDQVTAGHNIGIHVGNPNDPNSGCFRVGPIEADDLSAILSIGSPVEFRR